MATNAGQRTAARSTDAGNSSSGTAADSAAKGVPDRRASDSLRGAESRRSSERLRESAPPAPPPAAAALDWLRKAVFGTTEDISSSSSSSSSSLGDRAADTKKLLKKIEGARDVSTLLPEARRDLDLIAAQFDLAVVHGGTSPPKLVDTEQKTMELYTAQLTIAARLRRIKNLLYGSSVGSDDAAGAGGGGPLNLGRLSSFGGVTKDGDTAMAAAQAVQYLTRVDSAMIPDLFENFLALPFEARKDTASIFNFLLMSGIDLQSSNGNGAAAVDATDGRMSTPCEALRAATDAFVRYVEDCYEDIVTPLVLGHDCTGVPREATNAETAAATAATRGQENTAPEGETRSAGGGSRRRLPNERSDQKRSRRRRRSTPDVALHCGSMIRSLLSHFHLYELFVSESYVARLVFPFVDSYVHQANFEVSSDCLETLRMIMTGVSPTTGAIGHRPPRRALESAEPVCETTQDVARDLLDRCYVPLLEERFNRLLAEDAPYLTRRLSLQILSSILLTRSNYGVMMRYVSLRGNLRLVMCQLRDASPQVTFEAFQVFKVFVVNPDKKKEIVRVLTDNRDKLLRYMKAFHVEREGTDEQFRDEKALVVATLEALEAPEA